MKILISERRDTKNLGARHLTLYHKKNKKIGAHVGGQKVIDRALEAVIDIFHHAHGITKEQIKKMYYWCQAVRQDKGVSYSGWDSH